MLDHGLELNSVSSEFHRGVKRHGLLTANTTSSLFGPNKSVSSFFCVWFVAGGQVIHFYSYDSLEERREARTVIAAKDRDWVQYLKMIRPLVHAQRSNISYAGDGNIFTGEATPQAGQEPGCYLLSTRQTEDCIDAKDMPSSAEFCGRLGVNEDFAVHVWRCEKPDVENAIRKGTGWEAQVIYPTGFSTWQ